ncbi:MAG: sulfate transporter CysZ, partial [Gammaproteobacteria bacterium]|nr:sulfate transporter CysZ [Gammaproteobacteria bacterium]
MPSDFIRGAAYALAGFRQLGNPQLRSFVLGPILLNVALFTIAIIWVARVFERWMDWLVAWLPNWLDWLEWLFWPIFALAVILGMFYTFTMIANIVAAPLNGLLAEKVERLHKPGSSLPQARPMWAEIPHAIGHELQKWLYILPRAVPVLLLFLLPGLNVAAPFLWFGFGAWMLALEYSDYPLGNHGLAFRAQRELLRGRRMLVLGFGAAIMLMTLVPLLNFLS